jgi:hypothetical protein
MLATSVTLMISPPISYSPAIVGGFQENNLWPDNRMLLGSFMVSERLLAEDLTGRIGRCCHLQHEGMPEIRKLVITVRWDSHSF